MSELIETMESRTLFSASAGVIAADLAAIKSFGVKAKADLIAGLNVATADLKALKATVTAAHPTATQKQLVTSVAKVDAAAATKLKLQVNALLTAGTRDGAHLESVLKNLKTHPTDAALLAKAKASLAVLQNVFSTTAATNLETIAANDVANLDAALNSVSFAFPTAQADVNSFQSHLAADLTTLSTDATAIQAAIGALAVDLG